MVPAVEPAIGHALSPAAAPLDPAVVLAAGFVAVGVPLAPDEPVLVPPRRAVSSESESKAICTELAFLQESGGAWEPLTKLAAIH